MDEFILKEPLNKVQPTDVPAALKQVNEKLNANGVFKFFFLDIRIIGDLVVKGAPYEQIDKFVYNDNKSIMDINMIQNLLPHFGFKIQTIESVKNDPIVKVTCIKVGEAK